MSEINIPLLRKAVEWVEAQDRLPVEKREWMQTIYTLPEEERLSIYDHESGCGTAYCVAGYIGAMTDPAYLDSQWKDGIHVSQAAAEALGLDSLQSSQLFSAANSASMIRQFAESFAGEAL